ncbi:hypothetical protein [Vallitalea maricola]|uniref:Uncharacterized protein n=1 Tax=Vallitalea maricola TaxID=3074433 RepID=A0ACB5UGQ6_9FIRM|nr:hypothetical protein AN2V17_09480 [Vallitalea sp. AN17-2]
MRIIKLFFIILLICCIGGCSVKPTDGLYDVTSLRLEFDNFSSEDNVPITNVLLVVNENRTHRLFVGKYFASFQKLDNITDWNVMDNSISNYLGWYAGGGVIISLIKEKNEYCVYEKYVEEGMDNSLSPFIKAASITVNNPSVKLLDAMQNKVDTDESGNAIFKDEVDITESNWMNHPKIVEIRAIYNAIEKSLKSEQLTVTNKNTTNNLSLSKDIIIYKDANQKTRKYTEQGGSDDSAYTTSYYYDDLNNLRFVFLELGATNGTNAEYRLYYDKEGNKIWEHSKLLDGPGYPFNVDDYISFPVTK